jgi:hypothetical protein
MVVKQIADRKTVRGMLLVLPESSKGYRRHLLQ